MPFSDQKILSKSVLITLQEWESFVVSVVYDDTPKRPDIEEVIRRLEHILRDEFHDLLSSSKDLISVAENILFPNSLFHRTGVQSPSLAKLETLYNFHIYSKKKSSFIERKRILEMTSSLQKYTTPKSFVRHVTVCYSEFTKTALGNVYEWPTSYAGDVLSKPAKCLDKNDLPISRKCLWNFKTGAHYEPFSSEKCSRFSACPKGFTNIQTRFCLTSSPKNTWQEGFTSAFSTGNEVALLGVINEYKESIEMKDIFKILLTSKKIKNNVTWLPIRRVHKHGPLIDLTINGTNISDLADKSKYSWVDEHPRHNDDCVALNIITGKLFTSDCFYSYSFISIVDLTTLPDSQTTSNADLHSDSDNDVVCRSMDGIAPGINLPSKICVLIKSVNYTGWTGANEKCKSFGANLPQPGRLFMNWVYKNLMNELNISSIFIGIGNTDESISIKDNLIEYPDWQMNAQLQNKYGLMEQKGWTLSNQTNSINRSILLCEKHIEDNTKRHMRLYSTGQSNTLLLDFSNVENAIKYSLQCYRNGRLINQIDFTDWVNDTLIVHLQDEIIGYYYCTIWKNNKFELVSSNTLVERSLEQYCSIIIKILNVGKKYIPLVRENTFNEYNNYSYVLDRNVLDQCQETIVSQLYILGNNIEMEISRIEHIFFSPPAFEHMRLQYDIRTVLSFSETILYEALQKVIRNSSLSSSDCRLVDVRSTVGCRSSELHDPKTGRILTWVSTTRSGKFAPRELCIDSKGFPVSRECLGDLMEGFYWDSAFDGNCMGSPSNITVELYGIRSDISKYSKLPELTENPELLTPVDLSIVSSIFSIIAEETTNSSIKNITLQFETVVNIMNNILSLPDDHYRILHTKLNTTNELLDSFEQLLFSAKKDTKVEIQNHIHISALRINLVEGNKTIGFSSSNINGKEKSQLINENLREQLSNVTAEIMIQNNFSKHISAALVKRNVKITFAIYHDGKLFVDNQSKKKNYLLNSQVVQASVEGFVVTNLVSPVKILFKPFKEDNNGICAYWDFSLNNNYGGWSTDGCWKGPVTDNLTTCYCDHLTSFALLMNFDQFELDVTHTIVLDYITMIGCLLSVLGLFMVFITYIFFEKWRKALGNKILFHLSLAIFFSLLLFVGGINKTEISYVCRGIAVLLHYFILASFNWMLVEGVHQYLKFVKVIGTYIPRFIWKAAVISWGFPILPIVCLLIIDGRLYDYNYTEIGMASMCWISPLGFRYAFLPQLVFTMSFNLFLFIRILISVVYKRPSFTSTVNKEKLHMQELSMAICVFSLLGFTWVFGLLSIFDPSLVFSYLFCIFNTLQGFFIFIFHITRDRSIRKELLNFLAITKRRSSISSSKTRSDFYNSQSKGSTRIKHGRGRSYSLTGSSSKEDDLPHPTYDKNVRLLVARTKSSDTDSSLISGSSDIC